MNLRTVTESTGAESAATKPVLSESQKRTGTHLEKGYAITEAIGLGWQSKEPISLFSQIHSSVNREFVSTNAILFNCIDQMVCSLQRRCLFVFDLENIRVRSLRRRLPRDRQFTLFDFL